MGTIAKLAVAASVAFGFHYAVQHVVSVAVRSQLGDPPPSPAAPRLDPETLRQSMAISRAAETSAAARAVIEDAERRIDEMNRNAQRAVPTPPYIPGMRRY